MGLGEIIDGRYEIEAVVGEGGMGTVYCTLDRATGQRVALKRLVGSDMEATARFAEEASLRPAIRIS